jgi:DNA-binding response OmpR family regulator
MRLSDLRLLLVDGDQDSLEVLATFLASEGAHVDKALTGAEAVRCAEQQRPHVLISELELPDQSGDALLLALRTLPDCAELPAVALTAHTGLSARAQALSAGYQKYLVKPVLLEDVAAAVSSIGRRRSPLESPAGSSSHAALRQLLSARDYRSLLATLNASTEHRFSSVFRFDESRLSSVWTYDRANPESDGFPVELALADSYCIYLYEAVSPLVIEDSLADTRVVRHRRRHEIRSFCGVPLFSGDGALFGALCHFDHAPHQASESVLDLLATVAHLFRLETAHSERPSR